MEFGIRKFLSPHWSAGGFIIPGVWYISPSCENFWYFVSQPDQRYWFCPRLRRNSFFFFLKADIHVIDSTRSSFQLGLESKLFQEFQKRFFCEYSDASVYVNNSSKNKRKNHENSKLLFSINSVHLSVQNTQQATIYW